mmetsp:Transcript_13977/g.22893  ORF Transcript_13977/g.22893 Transcript_13977/m.22893 type:complete len:273 (-) Transcript_13977:880-1698(-)
MALLLLFITTLKAAVPTPVGMSNFSWLSNTVMMAFSLGMSQPPGQPDELSHNICSIFSEPVGPKRSPDTDTWVITAMPSVPSVRIPCPAATSFTEGPIKSRIPLPTAPTTAVPVPAASIFSASSLVTPAILTITLYPVPWRWVSTVCTSVLSMVLLNTLVAAGVPKSPKSLSRTTNGNGAHSEMFVLQTPMNSKVDPSEASILPKFTPVTLSVSEAGKKLSLFVVKLVAPETCLMTGPISLSFPLPDVPELRMVPTPGPTSIASPTLTSTSR